MMKLMSWRRIVLLFLLTMILAIAVEARLQTPASPPASPPQTTAIGPWDWLENALTTAPTVEPLTVANSALIGLWRLKSIAGSATAQPVTVVRQYASHPDGMLALAEFTIDDHAVPRFRVYSAKPGVPAAIYTDETFSRFLLNGNKTTNTISFRLIDRNSISELTTERRSALKVSGDTLTDVSELLDSAGNPTARETRVFTKQTATLDPIRLPAASAAPLSSAPVSQNPLLGTWALNEAKSAAKPEAGSVTLHRFIDLGKGAFGTLLVRLSRAGAPTMEMTAVKFGGPDELVLAFTVYALPQLQIFLEREALPASAVAYKMIDPRTIEASAKSLANGKTSTVTTRRFTEAFTEFTETRTAFDTQGKQTGETVTVFTKVSAN